MPNIKPVSDLRTYNDILREIAVGQPVFLTKNGRGRYAILDIREYEETQAALTLLSKLIAKEKKRKQNTT
jgi:PHD/YefM family antitoxin component YafN of YafNO toxin-antitoxin module